MKQGLNQYRLAGAAGGLLLAAGQFIGYLCVFQLVALIPVTVLALRDRRPRWAALAGLYMGIAYTIPQMIYLRMPVPVTAILLVWMTVLLIVLCMLIAVFLPRHPVLGPLAVGAVWAILDWINYTAVPVWGMAQSFARAWTAYPFVIQFISITGVSGVLFVVGALQGLMAYLIHPLASRGANGTQASCLRCAQRGLEARVPLTIAILLTVIIISDTCLWFQKSTGSLGIAAAGWVFDDTSNTMNPNESPGFEKLFAVPAQQAAAQGARIFTTGEMGFYIAKHEWDKRIEQFAKVARENNLWLVVGYFHVTDDENRIFFMSPQGEIVHEYTKTHLTPFEPGQKGSGDLKTVTVEGLTVGGMICQDDNFSKLTRHYGNLKADVVLCPTADWWTIKDAHMQAVRARAIECNYPIVRGAACGISAVISARGEVLTKHDHYKSGPGYVIADIAVYRNKTLFSCFGHWPSLFAATACIVWIKRKNRE
jgi:apolipoprotein N-acyltransferase